MANLQILLLDCESPNSLGADVRVVLASSENKGVKVHYESKCSEGLATWGGKAHTGLSQFRPDVILLVLSAHILKQACDTLISVKAEFLSTPIIVVMAATEPEAITELLGLGATDFVTAPFKLIDIMPRILRLQDQARRVDPLTQTLKDKLGLQQFVGGSAVFLDEIRKIPLIARSDVSVLIGGETGTGKELCARAIHYLSPRAAMPFVPVNCGAIPVDLAENELFGHDRGAFTGAVTAQSGLIHEANGGTLFLDEIDCMPAFAQVKLLRFLQDKQYRPLGTTKMRQSDVRVIAATNADVERAVRTGQLRQDLYYRLNTVLLSLPPLRNRREDIPLLARHFLAKYTAVSNPAPTGFARDAMQRLLLHPWPGNVRELEHIVHRAMVLCESPIIHRQQIQLPDSDSEVDSKSFKEAKAGAVAQFERSYLEGLLLAHSGNITQAARAAQKNRRAFWQLIHKHRIDVNRLKTVSSCN